MCLQQEQRPSAEVIAGTNMNDNPTTDGEISKDMTAEPIESDATKKRDNL